MRSACRAAWILGNWLAQIVFAFKTGYRDGCSLRPGARASPFPTNSPQERGSDG